jgi:antitoxin VapB
MALKIEDEQAEQLAQELARQTGEPVGEAVTVALKERLDRVGRRQIRKPDREAIAAILADFRSLPDLDMRSPDEILGYNEAGLFD